MKQKRKGSGKIQQKRNTCAGGAGREREREREF
jgi:hypothetical protein